MTVAIESHDALRIPQNNLLDGREYAECLAFVLPSNLREGDVITDGIGTYQVSDVTSWPTTRGPDRDYIRHIRIAHTLAGPVMGGLIRGQQERIHLLARRRLDTTEPDKE